MQRKSFVKLLLAGLGYMLLGNVMCGVMTMSLAPFIGNTFIKVMAFLFALFIFYALVFTVAYKDGHREQGMVRLKRVEPPANNRWVLIGLAMMGIMFIPSLILFIDKVGGFWFDVTMIYRFVCGMVYPLSLLVSPGNIDSMPVFMPFVYMLCYALVPALTHIGFIFGYSDKFDKDKIMYQ